MLDARATSDCPCHKQREYLGDQRSPTPRLSAILELPLVGNWLQERLQDIPTVRKETPEEFMAPLVVPKSPERFYFLFGRPVELSPADADDREEMAEVYNGVKAAVEQGIEYLVGRRELDPYSGFLRRQLYEASRREQAPSADP